MKLLHSCPASSFTSVSINVLICLSTLRLVWLPQKLYASNHSFFHINSNFISHATHNRVASCSLFAKPLVTRAHSLIIISSTLDQLTLRSFVGIGMRFFAPSPNAFIFACSFMMHRRVVSFFVQILLAAGSPFYVNLFLRSLLMSPISNFVYMYKANISYTELLTQLATE